MRRVLLLRCCWCRWRRVQQSDRTRMVRAWHGLQSHRQSRRMLRDCSMSMLLQRHSAWSLWRGLCRRRAFERWACSAARVREGEALRLVLAREGEAITEMRSVQSRAEEEHRREREEADAQRTGAGREASAVRREGLLRAMVGRARGRHIAVGFRRFVCGLTMARAVFERRGGEVMRLWRGYVQRRRRCRGLVRRWGHEWEYSKGGKGAAAAAGWLGSVGSWLGGASGSGSSSAPSSSSSSASLPSPAGSCNVRRLLAYGWRRWIVGAVRVGRGREWEQREEQQGQQQRVQQHWKGALLILTRFASLARRQRLRSLLRWRAVAVVEGGAGRQRLRQGQRQHWRRLRIVFTEWAAVVAGNSLHTPRGQLLMRLMMASARRMRRLVLLRWRGMSRGWRERWSHAVLLMLQVLFIDCTITRMYPLIL
jgi:hypothetical protein